MRKLALTLALAALLIPGLSLAEETPQAQQTPNLTLEEILRVQPSPIEAALWSPPGCAKPCKSNANCPYYPEQICLNGCCVF